MRAHDGAGRPPQVRPGRRRGDAHGHGHRADRRHDRHRRRRARRGADALHRREGRPGPRQAARLGMGRFSEVDIAVDPLEGHEPLRDRRAERHRRARRVRAGAACCTRPTSTWRSSSSVRARRTHVSLDAPVAENLKAIAKAPRPRRRRPGRRSCSIAPRHEKLIADIRATGARIRLIGDGDLSAGITAAVVGLRRPRRDGHRRRARRRADGRGDALPERRDLRAPRRQQARARGALPRDGDHATSRRSTARRISRPGKSIIFAATGVTDGTLMRGVRFFGDGNRTSSVIMRIRRRGYNDVLIASSRPAAPGGRVPGTPVRACAGRRTPWG